MRPFQRPQKQPEKRLRINNQIRASQVTLIDDEGNNRGIVPIEEALRIAQEKELDLVEIAPTAQPPIAKILDYGKYMYQKEKKAREGKQKNQDMKVVQLGFKTGQHDLFIRAEQADKFLAKGHRIKVELRLRGREKGMAPLGKEKMKEFLTFITYPYATEESIKQSPSGFNIILKPEKK